MSFKYLIPSTETTDLGTSSKKWSNAYIKDVYAETVKVYTEGEYKDVSTISGNDVIVIDEVTGNLRPKTLEELSANDVGTSNVTIHSIINNSAADKNLSNISDTGKKAFFPSSQYTSVATNTTSYTAPTNGYIAVQGSSPANAYGYIELDRGDGYIISDASYSPADSVTLRLILAVSKGDVIALQKSDNVTIEGFNFFYANGDIPTSS